MGSGIQIVSVLGLQGLHTTAGQEWMEACLWRRANDATGGVAVFDLLENQPGLLRRTLLAFPRAQRQNFISGFGDEDGMFPLRRQGMIFSDHGPAIR